MSVIYGTEAGETLDSSASAASDSISGYGGNDTITGGSFADWIDGGEGDDNINAGSGNDTISGGNGSDTIFGDAGDDYFEIGGIGNDSIDGGAGADKFVIDDSYLGNSHTLTGGLGSDNYIINNYKNSITVTDFTAGTTDGDIFDVSYFLKNSYNLTSNPFSSGHLRLLTNGLDTLLQWDQDGLSNQYSWRTVATLQNTNKNDFVAANFSPLIPTDGSAVTGVLTITGTTGSDQLTGGIGNNSITGLAGNDKLTGFFGNDTLIGGLGYDILPGGAGNDSLVGGESGTNADDFGNQLFGGNGDDTLIGADFAGDGDVLLGGNGNDSLSGLAGDDSLDGGFGNDMLFGGMGNDYFTDEYGNNSISGGDGIDTFDIFSTGLNTISGGAGADLFILYQGNQLRITDFESTDIFDIGGLLNANLGTISSSSNNPFNSANGYFRLIQDTNDVLFQWDIDGTTSTNNTWQTVVIIENKIVTDFSDANFSPILTLDGNDVAGISITIAGTFEGSVGSDSLTGDTGGNTFYGYAGNDTLIGNDGLDVLYGGQGNDTLVGGSSTSPYADTASNSLYGGEGNDFLVGSSFSAVNADGFTEGDILYGENGNDSVTGLAGNDTLDGGLGNDTLEGGLGDDWLEDSGDSNSIHGGAGNDTLYVYSDIATDSSTLTGGSGVDRFILSAGNLGSLSITDFEVGAAGDLLDIDDIIDNSIGYSSGNLFGSQGYLRLEPANTGADTLLQWDKDGATGSANTWQTLVTLTGVLTTTVTLDNFSTPMSPTGTAVANQTLTGTVNNDTLRGNVADDTIVGNGGYDQLLGSGGNDSITGSGFLSGGAGNDFVTAILSTTSYGEIIPNELQGGTGDDTLIGNTGDDYFSDYSGANSVNGGAGSDTFDIASTDSATTISTITGGAGSDTFFVNAYGLNAPIITDFTAGVGGDIINVNSLLSKNTTYTSAAGDPFSTAGYLRVVQNGTNALLQWDKDGAANATSSWVTILLLNNVSTTALVETNFSSSLGVSFAALPGVNISTTGNDTITGSAGTVTLAGGLGDDLYIVSDAKNVIVESNIGGTDAVESSVSFTLPKQVEKLTLTGTANIDATGNNLANRLIGNNGNNWLNGGLNADTMEGGLGDDTYYVDNTADVIVEAIIGGGDDIESIVTYTLPDNVEVLALLGVATINGTGNGGNNIIYGNEVANVLYGLAGNDSLGGGRGRDTLDGGAGLDTINGGFGVDLLTGGADADTFVFMGDSGIGILRDVITDFNPGIDKIDLSAMNISGSAGTGTLVDMFTMRWSYYSNYAVVQADTNENPATIEFEIKLDNVTLGNPLSNSDFIFVSSTPPNSTSTISVTAAGSGTASTSNVQFSFTSGDYTYSISGFGAGDVLNFPDNAAATVINDMLDDGNVNVEWADDLTGQIITVTLTGLTAQQDVALYSVESFNVLFGAGSLI